MATTGTWSAVGVLGVVLASGLACGGSGGLTARDAGGGGDGGGGDAAPPPTATEFCLQVEATRTALYIKCYGGKPSDWPIFTGPSACPTLAQEIEQQRVTYDPTKANACLAEIAIQPACDALWPERPCITQVLRGSVAQGHRCDNPFVCQVGTDCGLPQSTTNRCATKSCQRTPDVPDTCETFCKLDATCVDGRCQPNLRPGERCGTFDLAGCQYGSYCAMEDAEPTCKRVFQDGPCTSSAGCFDHQFCDTTTMRCRARLELGADCSLDPAACQSFTACDPATKRCVEASRLGQLCGNLIGFPFLCEGGVCQPLGDAQPRCITPAANGAACSEGFECGSGSCVAGKCAPLASDGASCADASTCASGLCTASMCVSPAADGAPCRFGDECASGTCTSGACVACP